MNYSKWLKITISLTGIFLLVVVTVNFYIDSYGVRTSLFNPAKFQNSNRKFCATGMNQHISAPEQVFSRPQDFDSFIFGSSRTSVIDPRKMTGGKYFNMSYAVGLPSEHLAVVKAFLKKGIHIKTVVIGLDESYFSISPEQQKNQLINIMHPYITGDSLINLFYRYFCRMPKLFEISLEYKRLFKGEQKDKCITDENGMNIGWLNKEKTIIASGKPIFTKEDIRYEPTPYSNKALNESLNAIDELNILARKNNFTLIVFINPTHSHMYLHDAHGLFAAKEKIAQITDYYDFSGLNSVTTNDLAFIDEGHYRYLVGDIIIKRIFGSGNINIPIDFGVLVTKKNVNEHIRKQKLELKKYLSKTMP